MSTTAPPKNGDDLFCPDHPNAGVRFDEDGPYCPVCGKGLS